MPQLGEEITLALQRPAAVAAVAVLAVDLRDAIGFSSFGVLLYYLIANLSAFTQPPEHRRFPRWLQVLGAVGCLLLTATLPWQALLSGLVIYVIGIADRISRSALPRW